MKHWYLASFENETEDMLRGRIKITAPSLPALRCTVCGVWGHQQLIPSRLDFDTGQMIARPLEVEKYSQFIAERGLPATFKIAGYSFIIEPASSFFPLKISNKSSAELISFKNCLVGTRGSTKLLKQCARPNEIIVFENEVLSEEGHCYDVIMSGAPAIVPEGWRRSFGACHQCGRTEWDRGQFDECLTSAEAFSKVIVSEKDLGNVAFSRLESTSIFIVNDSMRHTIHNINPTSEFFPVVT